MKSPAAGIAILAVTLAMAGGAQGQLGLGLPPIGLPSASPLPPSDFRATRPSVRAPMVPPDSQVVRREPPSGARAGALRATGAPAASVGETLDRADSYAERARDALDRRGDVLEADARGRPAVPG